GDLDPNVNNASQPSRVFYSLLPKYNQKFASSVLTTENQKEKNEQARAITRQDYWHTLINFAIGPCACHVLEVALVYCS
ncbi:hypothetical protein BB560_000689, partial [Smittium megazygosporum]